MTRYGSLDEIYKNIAAIEGSIGKKIAEGRENAYFSQSLIRLRSDVDLPITSIDDLSIDNINRSAGADILMREGIRQSAMYLKNSNIEQSVNVKTVSDNHVVLNMDAEQELLGNGIYKIIDSIKELESFLEQAKKQKLLSLDFETDSLDAWNSKPIGISLAIKPKEAFYVPVASHGSGCTFLAPEKVFPLFFPLFADAEMTIVAHNAKFDYKASRGFGAERWKCKIWDTMVAAWVVDPERNNYSLDSLASHIFNCNPIKYFDIVQKGAAFDSVDLETAAQYSCEDADYCIRLKHHFEPALKKTESLTLFENMEMPLLPILAEMEGEGIKIEPKALTDYGKELAVELDQIQAETWKIVGHEFNLSSTKQLQEVLFVERKLNPGKKTKTGYSTDAAALEELAHEDPVPALILRHRTLAKLKSTYVDTLAEMADSKGRLHTNFVQTGTATGRLSSREPNLQNIPIRAEEGRRIREAFVAKSGHVLISADYSQIELVILAHLSQDANLISAFRDAKDVHARTAALIFGIEENQVKNEQRRMAKIINFGVIYGMSAFRLAKELNITRTAAQTFISTYFNTYSGVKQFIEDIIEKTEQQGYVTTIAGRRRYIPTINSRNKTEKSSAERIAVNTPIQGSAADIVKTAMLSLDKKLADSNARLLLQVHDELIFECPKDESSKIAALVKAEMEQAVQITVPLCVTVEIGTKWGDFH
jgi:DNA polymerase-1